MGDATEIDRTFQKRRSLPSRFSRVVLRRFVRVVENGLRESRSTVGWDVRYD